MGACKDKLHVDFTSKDIEQVRNFKKSLELGNKISKKTRVKEKEKKYYYIQFGYVIFVQFLELIGVMPTKSKILGPIEIPDRFFFDFLCGCFDGDGSFYSYWDKRGRSSLIHYISFVSASPIYITWMREQIRSFLGVSGHIPSDGK